MRDSFIFYRSFFEASKPLNAEQKADLFDAICEYALNQEETERQPIVNAMFTLVKPQIDANFKRYKNGQKGGRPKTKAKPKNNQTITKAKPNVNDNVNVNDNHNGNVNHNENENQNELSKDNKAKAFSTFHFKKTLLDLGVNKEHLEDWLKIRTKKKASNTKTALKTFLNECNRNNFPISEAVKICAQNDWKGFKYEWIKTNNNGQTNKNEKYNYDDLKRKLATTLRSG